MQLVGKYGGTLRPWVCAPNHRGSVLVLGGKRWLGGSKLRLWGWGGHKWPRSSLTAWWRLWAPTNWGDKPELQLLLWGGISRCGGPCPTEAGEAPMGQESWLTQWNTQGRMSSDLFLAYVSRWVNKNSFRLICICWVLSVCLCDWNDALVMSWQC